jgi:hypothetical protein
MHISITAGRFQNVDAEDDSSKFLQNVAIHLQKYTNHNPKDNNQKTRRHENLKPYTTFFH